MDTTKLSNFICELFLDEPTGHDWWHISRVRSLSKYIAEREGGNLELVDLIALFHEVDDPKVNRLSYSKAKSLLDDSPYDSDVILRNATNISFSRGDSTKLDLEGKIVQDADRLDALGAIGIARVFSTSSILNRPIYDPTTPLDGIQETSAIHHFYRKLFKLPDLMNTHTARELAFKRVDYMRSFLDQFFKEWNF